MHQGIRVHMAPSTVVRLAGLVLAGLVMLGQGSTLQARSTSDEMMRLDPAERIEQVCNTRAMGEVQRANKGMKPDELVAYAYRDPIVKGWKIKAPGAAVRSGNDWYHLTYDCETQHDGLEVKSFTYKLGAVIPKAEWGSHYLVAQ